MQREKTVWRFCAKDKLIQVPLLEMIQQEKSGPFKKPGSAPPAVTPPLALARAAPAGQVFEWRV